MILFQQDWAREGGSVHTNTENKSFLRVSMVLKKMGIQNYLFPLAILQKDLEKYDPHNLKDNSSELRMRIALECTLNPWYFFREVARVPASGGTDVPFKANRANIAMIWCFLNYLHYIAIQPRQTGKTFAACQIIVYVMYLYGRNIETSLYTKDSALIQANVGRIKAMRDALPDYLIHNQIKDTDNKEGLSYERLRNRYKTYVAQSSEQGADNLGRGMTTPVVHIDEPGFITNIHITYPIMMLSTITAVQNAAANNQPHSNILTTTAARIDTERGRFTFNLVNSAMPMTECIYDLKNNTEVKELVRANSTNDMINGTYSYLMLGLTHEWYLDACRKSSGSQEDNDRELLNEWKSGTDSSILDPETIKILNGNKHEPTYTEIINDYIIRWYLERTFVESSVFKGKKFVLGMDSSENIGQDFTTLCLVDVSDLSVAATFRCNESNTARLGMFIAEFLMMYPNVTFIPERNSTGGAIVDIITMIFQRNHINPFRRIYNEVVQNRQEPEYERINIDNSDIIDTSAKRYLGFRTTGKSRPYLYKNTLIKAVKMNATRINDITLISELCSLSASDGRIDHVSGGHDDMVIAYLLACWLIFSGKNLNYYGIDVRSIMTSITSDGVKIDPVHRDKQLGIRRQIKLYQDLAETASSPIIKNTYLQKISLLSTQLDNSITIEPIGVSKIDQEISDYGKNIYTPEQFANKIQPRNNSPENLSKILKLIY